MLLLIDINVSKDTAVNTKKCTMNISFMFFNIFPYLVCS